jgi:uncharacterized protein YegP (UPF0339 family)
MTSAAILADTERVYRSREKDVWEILENNGQYAWRRTATNKEIVGSSSEVFNSLKTAEQNAMLFGYEGQYNVTSSTDWKFYRDDKSEYRWTATYNGLVINKAHEGYVSEKACLLNAVRHGYTGHLDKDDVQPVAKPDDSPLLADMLDNHSDLSAPLKTPLQKEVQTSDRFLIIWGMVLIVLVLLLGYFLSVL